MTLDGMLRAMVDTCTLAANRGGLRPGGKDDADSLAHLWDMRDRMESSVASGDFGPAQVGRWLGYAQGVCVARGTLTLEEVKQINLRYREPK